MLNMLRYLINATKCYFWSGERIFKFIIEMYF